MSNTPQVHSHDHDTGQGSTPFPRAVVHKQILAAAEDAPGDSMEALAARVSGASVDLVERVLEAYGDPASADAPTADGAADEPVARHERDDGAADGADTEADSRDERGATSEPEPEPEPGSGAGSQSNGARNGSRNGNAPADGTGEGSRSGASSSGGRGASAPGGDGPLEGLSAAQRETLAAIAEHPEATQRELADVLGVSCATVNRRVNAVEGFEWDGRRTFVEAAFGGDARAAGDERATDGASDDGTTGESRSSEGEASGSTDEPSAASESELEPAPETDPAPDPAASDGLALAHKVLRACIESDRISEHEEREVLRLVVPELVGRESASQEPIGGAGRRNGR